jgi:PhnB protein
MTTKPNPIPDGFHTVTPYLSMKNASQAIEFYKRAFGATERYRLSMPGGRIGQAELQIGTSIVMLADEFPEHGNLSPETLNGSPVGSLFTSMTWTPHSSAPCRQARPPRNP